MERLSREQIGRWMRESTWLKRSLAAVVAAFLLYNITGYLILPYVIKVVLAGNIKSKLHREAQVESVQVNPYTLSVRLTGFRIGEPESEKQWLSIRELFVNLQVSSILRRAVVLSELKIVDPEFRVERNEDGSLNFSDLLEKKEDAGEEGKKPSTPRFSISNIEMVNGRLTVEDRLSCRTHQFRDLSLSIPFIATVGDPLTDWVQPLLEAKSGEGSFSLTGKARPFSDSRDVSADLELKDVDLAHYFPYMASLLPIQVNSGHADIRTRIEYSRSTEGEHAVKVSGEVVLKDFEAVESDEKRLLKFQNLVVAVESLDPGERSLHVSRVFLDSPEADIRRNRKGVLNFSTLVAPKKVEEAPAVESAEEKAFSWRVDELEINQGMISLLDDSVKEPFQTYVQSVNVRVSGLSNATDSAARFEVTGKIEEQGDLNLAGTVSVDPFRADGTADLSGVQVRKYAPYYRGLLSFDIEDAILGIKTGYSTTGKGPAAGLKLSGFNLSLDSLKLRRPGEKESFLEIPGLELRDAEVDLDRKSVVVGEVKSRDGKVSVVRDRDGSLNLASLVPGSGWPETKGDPVEQTTGAGPGWQFMVKNGSLQGYTLKIADHVPSAPVNATLDQLRLSMQNVTNAKDSKVGLSLSSRLNESGSIAVEGTAEPDSLYADLKLDLKDVDLLLFQPYLPEDIRVRLKQGKVSAAGNLAAGRSEEPGVNAAYVGNVTFTDLATFDGVTGDDVVSLKILELKGVDAGNNPRRVHVGKAEIKNFRSRVFISSEGRINVVEVLGAEPAKAKGAAAPPPAGRTGGKRAPRSAPPPGHDRALEQNDASPFSVKVDEIAIQGGTISFSDHYIKPNFHAEMFDVGGTILGLSSEKNAVADIRLEGKLDKDSPLRITGKVSPFGKDLFAEVSIKFINIDLTRMNPYAKKYVGYSLEKGKLYLELEYAIVQRKLNSKNNILFDQLTLGEKVDSPDATTLPIKFALSLLQDRSGVIKLGVPVTGDIDDPQFSFGSVIAKTIRNFILKIVTAPFAVLGSIFGADRGEQLNHVEFEYGSSDILPETARSLDTLAQALYDRPRLEIAVEGHVDPEKDKEALHQKFFLDKLKAQKLKETVKESGSKVTLDKVTLNPDEFEKYLKMAYKEEFSRGVFKKLLGRYPPPEEMKKELLALVQVGEEDLRLLANRRAIAVRDYILGSGRIEPKRITVVESGVKAPQDQPDLKKSRVSMKLR
ncbi:MAG: DUF748 domain-containing protein [Syntrophobacteraceae bacterium]|nr:DUF748 domain-containing protein [Syntrophobacteraceae bacterium]